jgi:hypothetical protein
VKHVADILALGRPRHPWHWPVRGRQDELEAIVPDQVLQGLRYTSPFEVVRRGENADRRVFQLVRDQPGILRCADPMARS